MGCVMIFLNQFENMEHAIEKMKVVILLYPHSNAASSLQLGKR